MDPLEQDELKRRIDLLAVDEDMDDLCTFYCLFLNALNLMAAEKSPLFSLETTAPPPPHTASTVPRLPQKTRPQCIYLVTATPKPFAHFRMQNQPTQHRHPPRKKPPPSQPHPTPRQCQYSDSQTKPHCKHPPNYNLPTKTTLDIGNNACRRISQKAACISRH